MSAVMPLLMSRADDGQPLVVQGTLEESIRQSLLNILATHEGERKLLPEFGSRIRSFVFRRLEETTVQELESHVRGCITRWEPRVELDTVLVESVSEPTPQVELHVRYQIKKTQSKHLLRLPLSFWEL